MKKIVFTFILMSSFVFVGNSQNAQLPANTQDFIQKNFSSEQIIKTDIDMDDISDRYEVELSNGIELDFNAEGKITKMESNRGLPNSVVPSPVLTYVNQNYPNQAIKEWELKSDGQEVELVNGIELKFTSEGKFLRVDR